MKKSFIALITALAILVGVVGITIFASIANSTRNGTEGQSESSNEGAVVVAGYTAEEIIDTSAVFSEDLLPSECWVLNGRLASGGNVTGTFGAQWNESKLYLAIQRGSYSITKLMINDVDFISSTNYEYGDIIELEFSMTSLGLGNGEINNYNKLVPIEILLSSGGSFSGYLKLSSVDWWKTSNVTNSLEGKGITTVPMRGFDVTDAVTRNDIGAENITNGLHLFDKYNATSGVTNYRGSRTEVYYYRSGYEEMNNREKTVYFSFDFNAKSMPEYELAAALGGYHQDTKYSNYGFMWQMADEGIRSTENELPYTSNVTMGGIVNTSDGLYLNVCGDFNSVLKLNKGLDETFNVGLAWHSNGDVTVYIDGVERRHYEHKTRNMVSTMEQGVRFMCWRDESTPRTSGDDFDITITNMAFGTAYPDAPVKTLEFKDIHGNNTNAEEVTESLNLLGELNKDSLFPESNIAWESSNPAVISNTGEVDPPATGAVKVTLTAKDAAGNQKKIDVVVLGDSYSSQDVMVVEKDVHPSVGAASAYAGKLFHFDSNNNSLVYNQGSVKKVNVIKLTDLDDVSRLNRETISIWTSNDNVTYTRVEDNYKLFHNGNDWYLYGFEAEAQYIKVNYTIVDTTESDFTNTLDSIMTVYSEDVFGANGGTFSESKTYTVTNHTGKKQLDYAWRIPSSELTEISDKSKIRVMLNGEYLYHYVSGNDLYVRIPTVAKDASVTLTILYGNANAMDISNKEAVYEVTYGTKEIFIDNNPCYIYSLKAGTVLRNGEKLDKDVLIRSEGNNFSLSYDGGATWNNTATFTDNIGGRVLHASGGYIFDNGRLYWRSYDYTRETVEGKLVNTFKVVIIYSDDGGKTWNLSAALDHPTVNGYTFKSLIAYTGGIALSDRDKDNLDNIDYIFPALGADQYGKNAVLLVLSKDGGKTWAFADTLLRSESDHIFEAGLTEATLMENQKGELVLYSRDQTSTTNKFAMFVSKDQGLTWERNESKVYGTNTQPVMGKIDGDPLFVWGGHNAFGAYSYNRMPLNVAVSYDGLYTFRNIQNVFSETYLEDYTQTKVGGFVTNPSVVKVNKDLIITFNDSSNKFYNRITDYENWFYRTKGIYDSFESGNTKYEGWITYMSGTAISEDTGNQFLEVQPNAVISRSVPYLQNGTVSFRVYSDGESTYTVELQSAFTPVMNKCAPVSLKVERSALSVNNESTGLTLENRWNTITVNLGLAKDEPTASVSVNGGNAAPVNVDTSVGDYVGYIVINTDEAPIRIDDVLIQSNLDAINYVGEIKPVKLGINSNPAGQDKAEGDKAVFRVEAQGYGLMYQWYVNDGSGWKEIVGATSASYTTDVLEISNDNLQYMCRVMDRNENVMESNPATLYVAPFSADISVSVAWGDMTFEYDQGNWIPDEHDYEEGTWSSSGNFITATNFSNVALNVTVSYTAEEGYGGIQGIFDKSGESTADATLSKAINSGLAAANGSVRWTLSLCGRPSADLDGGAIGKITIKVQPAS